MVLYLIGIGLYDQKDITVRGLEAVRLCDEVYLEHYTSILGIDKTELETFYEKEITIAPRNLVEQEAENRLLLPAKEKNIALLIVGDVFGATTHTDLLIRAKELSVEVQCIFNASILNAIGIVGLELYKYGKTTSIVFPDDNWLPETPYDVIKNNFSLGLHTLCLLDIKVAELSKQDMLKEGTGVKVVAQPPRFMTVKEGLDVLVQIEAKRKESVITKDMLLIGVARVGHPDMCVKVGTLDELTSFDFGSPLHCIVIPGNLQIVEEEALTNWK